MNYESMPVIRLTVERMKDVVLTHMGVVGSELGDVLDREIIRAIDSYPWQQEVDKIVHAQISKIITSFFSYGTGHQAVQNAVEDALKVALKIANED